jgi:hypothetical protein
VTPDPPESASAFRRGRRYRFPGGTWTAVGHDGHGRCGRRKRIREGLDLHPGQKIQAIQCGDRVELVPVKSVRQMRGFLRGIETSVPREADRL